MVFKTFKQALLFSFQLHFNLYSLIDTSDSEVENSSTQPARNLGRKRYSRAKVSF